MVAFVLIDQLDSHCVSIKGPKTQDLNVIVSSLDLLRCPRIFLSPGSKTIDLLLELVSLFQKL